jgi:AAA domain
VDIYANDAAIASVGQAALDLRLLISTRATAASKRWPNATPELIGRMLDQREFSLGDGVALGFLLSDMLAAKASEKLEPQSLRDALVALFGSGLMTARARHLPEAHRLAGLRIAERIGKAIKVRPRDRKELHRRSEELQGLDCQPDWHAFFEIRATTEHVKRVLANSIRQTMAREPIPYPAGSEGSSLSSADLLARAAGRQAKEADQSDEIPITYDLSDSNLRLNRVVLQKFRGAPCDLTVGFTHKNTAVSGIIFGENGVGKSTIADAIEFALQGRISRSSYFDSPLLSAVRHLSNQGDTFVEATLSDGVTIRRATVIANGVTHATPKEVRSGFRLAPISIKRSDILRFLDTEALERGSTFLDYFPADAGQLAVRPEEEVHKLQAEMAELRIKRSSFAEDLSRLIPFSATELADRGQFDNAVRAHIMMGATRASFEASGGWETVPKELREALVSLREAHDRLAVCKKRMEQTTQIFNPVAHRDQLNILRRVLRDVGIDISKAFMQIATEHPISKVEVVFGASSTLSLDIVITLRNGLTCFPQQIFSEAYQDLLAILFFVSVAREASKRGQARVMIMDDVLQSVDATIRHAFVNYLLDELSDWQLIFTTHDRLWRDQLRDLFDAHEHPCVERLIYDWSFDQGPRLEAETADPLSRDLVDAIASSEPRTVGAIAGQLLEVICDQLTRRIHLLVARTNDDRYTLGDLWPVVRDWLKGTEADTAVRSIAGHRYLRNLVIHADMASLGLSLRDARSFGEAVLSLYSLVRCAKCGSWIRGQRSPKCSCEALKL